MYLKERVYWDTLARVLRLDGREGEEGGQQNGNLTRERESSSAMLYYRIYTPQKMGYIFKHIREELLLYH